MVSEGDILRKVAWAAGNTVALKAQWPCLLANREVFLPEVSTFLFAALERFAIGESYDHHNAESIGGEEPPRVARQKANRGLIVGGYCGRTSGLPCVERVRIFSRRLCA